MRCLHQTKKKKTSNPPGVLQAGCPSHPVFSPANTAHADWTHHFWLPTLHSLRWHLGGGVARAGVGIRGLRGFRVAGARRGNEDGGDRELGGVLVAVIVTIDIELVVKALVAAIVLLDGHGGVLAVAVIDEGAVAADVHREGFVAAVVAAVVTLHVHNLGASVLLGLVLLLAGLLRYKLLGAPTVEPGVPAGRLVAAVTVAGAGDAVVGGSVVLEHDLGVDSERGGVVNKALVHGVL